MMPLMARLKRCACRHGAPLPSRKRGAASRRSLHCPPLRNKISLFRISCEPVASLVTLQRQTFGDAGRHDTGTGTRCAYDFLVPVRSLTVTFPEMSVPQRPVLASVRLSFGQTCPVLSLRKILPDLAQVQTLVTIILKFTRLQIPVVRKRYVSSASIESLTGVINSRLSTY